MTEWGASATDVGKVSQVVVVFFLLFFFWGGLKLNLKTFVLAEICQNLSVIWSGSGGAKPADKAQHWVSFMTCFRLTSCPAFSSVCTEWRWSACRLWTMKPVMRRRRTMTQGREDQGQDWPVWRRCWTYWPAASYRPTWRTLNWWEMMECKGCGDDVSWMRLDVVVVMGMVLSATPCWNWMCCFCRCFCFWC